MEGNTGAAETTEGSINFIQTTAQLPVYMETNKTTQILIPLEAQNRIIDQVLIQSGGVGLGVVLTLAGLIFMAKWLGLREAISGFVDKQKVEAKALSDLSEAFTLFAAEYRSSIKDVKDNLQGIKDMLTARKR